MAAPDVHPEFREVRAGQLTALLVGPDLRYVRFGAKEVLRRIYVAVRDHNWRTVPAEIDGFKVEATESEFHVAFAARHREGAVDFSWRGEMVGSRDGRIRYGMDGIANAAFRYNRIGFCVLHPPKECAGRRYVARTEQGEASGTWPTLVDPQRIVDGKYFAMFPPYDRLTVDLGDGEEARFAFEGDLFETEDQRNWTDASFKTYCTPLGLGFPHDARPGKKIAQAVTLSATGATVPTKGALIRSAGERSPAHGPTATTPIELTLGAHLGRAFPTIGFGQPSHVHPLSGSEAALLRATRPDHLRVDLHLGANHWTDDWARARADADRLACALEVAAFVTDQAAGELAGLAQVLSGAPLARLLVFHEHEETTPARWLVLARKILGPVLERAPLVGGTNVYFTEINRLRPDVAALDAVAYSCNPQVHAFDELSMVETLEGQRDTLVSARALAGDRPVLVTPVTLKPRFNPHKTGAERPLLPGELPFEVDARQSSLFAAAWALGSIKALAEAGAASLTYFETTGWRGILGTDPAEAFPLYHLFAELARAREGAALAGCESSDSLRAVGLALKTRAGLRIVCANFTARVQTIVLGPVAGSTVAMRRLDEENVLVSRREPAAFLARPAETISIENGKVSVLLGPFAIASLEAE